MASEDCTDPDPNGDVFLVLQSPDAPFALWCEPTDMIAPSPPCESKKKKKKKKESKKMASPRENALTVEHSHFLESPSEPGPALPNGYPVDAEPAPEAEPEVAAEGDYPAEIPLDEYQYELEPAEVEEYSLELDPVAAVEDLFTQRFGHRALRIKTSSKHLALASPYFRTRLEGNWKHAYTYVFDGCRVLCEKGWDTEAFFIILNAIHGRTNRMPRSVSLELLAKLAVLTDYYDCLHVMTFFSEVWVGKLRDTIPETYSRDLILWLVVSWVFRQDDVFETVTRTAIKDSLGPICTLELPIRDSLVDAIDRKRQGCVGSIIDALHVLLTDLRDAHNSCSFECDSIRLGALTKEMYSKGLYYPRPEPPFVGLSVNEIAAKTRKIRSPGWHAVEEYMYRNQHGCTLQSLIEPIVSSAEESNKGLKLEDFPSGSCNKEKGKGNFP